MSAYRIAVAGLALPLILAVFWQGWTCRNAGEPTGVDLAEIPKGSWGGDRAQMEVTEDGARLEFECANGTIESKIILDKTGKFDTSGIYVEERGGPMRGVSRRARFRGQTDGKTLTLTIVLTESGESIGPFTLKYGKRAQLNKCV